MLLLCGMETYTLIIKNFIVLNLAENYTQIQIADIEKMLAKFIEVTKDKQIVIK